MGVRATATVLLNCSLGLPLIVSWSQSLGLAGGSRAVVWTTRLGPRLSSSFSSLAVELGTEASGPSHCCVQGGHVDLHSSLQ